MCTSKGEAKTNGRKSSDQRRARGGRGGEAVEIVERARAARTCDHGGSYPASFCRAPPTAFARGSRCRTAGGRGTWTAASDPGASAPKQLQPRGAYFLLESSPGPFIKLRVALFGRSTCLNFRLVSLLPSLLLMVYNTHGARLCRRRGCRAQLASVGVREDLAGREGAVNKPV